MEARMCGCDDRLKSRKRRRRGPSARPVYQGSVPAMRVE